ncbi:MAG: hypothetical protein K2F60_05650, partial [Oscillospiraceae bacterium]|nr:hypothetical protein [Oscillospiraceae bacterium]
MINIKIKISAAAAVLVIMAGTLSVNAEVTENITVLGDSISTGYGLDDSQLSYCGYLQEYFDADLDNFAKDGRQTSELLEQIENDDDVRNSLENADLICVTIGGNDVLQIFLDAMSELITRGGNTSGEQFEFSQEFVQSFIMKFASAIGPAAAQAGENITDIHEQIRELNPDAPVIIQTVYNPFETDDEKLNSIMKPLKTFTALYLGVINNAVKQQPAVIADIHEKFDENSWLFTNIKEFDIHPNYVGHMLIAEEIIQNLKLTGNGEIFRTELNKLPEEYYSGIPDNITGEILELADGEFRTQKAIDSFTEKTETETEHTNSGSSQETSA